MTEEKLYTIKLPYGGRYDKTVRVFVPEHEEGETLPVIYMTDGQSIFDEESNPYGCWHTREAVREERKSTGLAAVIVGIHNDESPVQRANELTPGSIGEIICPDEMRHLLAPGGEEFDDFVVSTVMPAIEARFPVKTGRNNTAFCGSSSGGLQCFFTVLSHPDLFCAAGVFSAAFMFYPPEDMSGWIAGKIKENMPFLYIYSGGGDEMEKHILAGTESVYDTLLEIYLPEKMTEVILPDKPHHESAWEEVFRDFLHTFLARRDEF